MLGARNYEGRQARSARTNLYAGYGSTRSANRSRFCLRNSRLTVRPAATYKRVTKFRPNPPRLVPAVLRFGMPILNLRREICLSDCLSGAPVRTG